jgi:hypothetical protein
MASPKSGTAGSAVAPAEPTAALEAIDDATGAMTEAAKDALARAQAQYQKVKAKPYKPPETPEERAVQTSWIAIKLIDMDDNAVPGEQYELELPDGSVASGTLDDKGFARVDGIEPGTCKVRFPRLDRRAWEKV